MDRVHVDNPGGSMKSSPCIEFEGRKDRHGYGRAYIGNGVEQLAHRLEWERINGSIPKGMCVCHHCDNPGCIRPSHLFLGTHADNMADMKAKGRNRLPPPPARGHANRLAKLSSQQVREIRKKLTVGETQRSVANRFGVSQSAIAKIAARQTWGWLQ